MKAAEEHLLVVLVICLFDGFIHWCSFLSVSRFPVILRRFHLNPGTGGNGFHSGGDGVVRELLFRRAQVLSVLGERRAFRPYGIKGNSWVFETLIFICLRVWMRPNLKFFFFNWATTEAIVWIVLRHEILLAKQNKDKTVYSLRLEIKKYFF